MAGRRISSYYYSAIIISLSLYMEKRNKIVHLDDHKLFTDGVRNVMISNFPDVSYYVISNLFNNIRFDLLITDLAHPGLNGYEFAKAIRSFESASGGIPMPILLLTFHSDNTTPIIKKGLDEKIFDKYLSKVTTSDELAGYIRSIIGQE